MAGDHPSKSNDSSEQHINSNTSDVGEKLSQAGNDGTRAPSERAKSTDNFTLTDAVAAKSDSDIAAVYGAAYKNLPQEHQKSVADTADFYSTKYPENAAFNNSVMRALSA